MNLELLLQDDTGHQVVQFYFAKLFRRGNSNKTKVLYHMRVCQKDEDNNLSSIIEVYEREAFLEVWDNLSLRLRELVAARRESVKFSPLEQDVLMDFTRLLTTPQIAVEVAIDGVAYLNNAPEITGHISANFKFWTTVELLKSFQSKLYQILRNREFRNNVEQLPQPEFHTLYDEVEDEQTEGELAETEVISEEFLETDEDDTNLVKTVKASTEMFNELEQKVNGGEAQIQLEDWETEAVDEVGGEGKNADAEASIGDNSKTDVLVLIEEQPEQSDKDKAEKQESVGGEAGEKEHKKKTSKKSESKEKTVEEEKPKTAKKATDKSKKTTPKKKESKPRKKTFDKKTTADKKTATAKKKTSKKDSDKPASKKRSAKKSAKKASTAKGATSEKTEADNEKASAPDKPANS